MTADVIAFPSAPSTMPPVRPKPSTRRRRSDRTGARVLPTFGGGSRVIFGPEANLRQMRELLDLIEREIDGAAEITDSRADEIDAAAKYLFASVMGYSRPGPA